MDKNKLDEIAKEAKKEFDYLLIALGENYHCIITAELANFKVVEIGKEDDKN